MSKEKRAILIGAITIGTLTAIGIGFHVWTVNTIPFSYRQSLLDIVDYTAGKNIFNRADSLQ